MSAIWHSLPLLPSQLKLAHVLKSGQSFRWTHTPLPSPCPPPSAPTEYSLCLPDRLILLRQSPTHLHYSAIFPSGQSAPTATTEAWVRDYLQLEVDLEGLYRTWGEQDAVFRKHEGGGGVLEGVGVLRQEPWECLFSFICSSNNNISRITSMVQSAARHFSPPLLSYNLPSSEPSHSTPLPYHPFPPPSAFACPSVIPILRDLGFGYRAPFIQRTAAMLVEEHTDVDPEEWLRELRGWEVEMAREELLRFVGVGRKVADCVLLMSLDKNAIIPVDVHVHQIAQRLYSFKATGAKRSSTGEKVPMTPKLYEEVQNALSARWGDMGGWTQAVLFASDLPFLLSSLAPNSTKPLKQPMIRSSLLLPTASTSSLTPNSILGEQGLVAMPASLLESSSPPETKPSVAAGRLAFESGKSSTARVRKKRGVGEEGVRLKVKVKVEVGVVVKREEREGDETSGLEEVRREAEEGGSLGEKAKRRRRNA